jgi:ADP-dependent NAD(P)H-hydrate dehydratase / NAD(P)H-hydrate epimerase
MTLPAVLIDLLSKSESGHKYRYGHLLTLSGGVGRGGAARLAARAALRMGAGLVTLACPPAALQENAARLDAIMLQPLRDAAGLQQVLSDPRISALCLGPGLGLRGREEGLLATTLSSLRPCVLDADALTLLARADDLRAMLHSACVLTPHEGEFARLCPDLPQSGVPASERAAQAAARLGCVVLLKGAQTWIAAPDGQVLCADATGARAAPWLATAGSGDVLAGMIAGLLARGIAPCIAAHAAALVHQAAGRALGPGLIAEDLTEVLPQILREMGVK